MSPVYTSGQPLVPMIQLSDPLPPTPPLVAPMITLSAGTWLSLTVRSCFRMRIDVTEPRWLSKSLWRNHNVAASGTAPRIGLHMGFMPCSVYFTARGLQILTAKAQSCNWHLKLNNSIHTVKEYYVEHKT